jgi:hypothetical protein
VTPEMDRYPCDACGTFTEPGMCCPTCGVYCDDPCPGCGHRFAHASDCPDLDAPDTRAYWERYFPRDGAVCTAIDPDAGLRREAHRQQAARGRCRKIIREMIAEMD